jgi:hypothetical protein
VDSDLSQTRQPYEYAAGDPVNESDPTGKRPGCGVKCLTDLELWDYNTTLAGFQSVRNQVCAGHLRACANHGNSHGRYLDWGSDGCSGSRQNPGGFPFWKACERHDFGYRNYKEQNRCSEYWRGQIDINFYNDMTRNFCKHAPSWKKSNCYALAEIYFAFVRNVGHC